MFLYHIVNVKPSKLRYNDMCLNHLAIRILVMTDGRGTVNPIRSFLGFLGWMFNGWEVSQSCGCSNAYPKEGLYWLWLRVDFYTFLLGVLRYHYCFGWSCKILAARQKKWIMGLVIFGQIRMSDDPKPLRYLYVFLFLAWQDKSKCYTIQISSTLEGV